jgi:hypothetical protein
MDGACFTFCYVLMAQLQVEQLPPPLPLLLLLLHFLQAMLWWLLLAALLLLPLSLKAAGLHLVLEGHCPLPALEKLLQET